VLVTATISKVSLVGVALSWQLCLHSFSLVERSEFFVSMRGARQVQVETHMGKSDFTEMVSCECWPFCAPNSPGVAGWLVLGLRSAAVQRLREAGVPAIVHVRTGSLHKGVPNASHHFMRVSGAEDKLTALRQVGSTPPVCSCSRALCNQSCTRRRCPVLQPLRGSQAPLLWQAAQRIRA